MAILRTYIIKLSDEERAELKKTIHNKKTSKTILNRCQILLRLDEVHGTVFTHAQHPPDDLRLGPRGTFTLNAPAFRRESPCQT